MEELESLETQACEYNQSKESNSQSGTLELYVRSWQFRYHHTGDDLFPAIAKEMSSRSILKTLFRLQNRIHVAKCCKKTKKRTKRKNDDPHDMRLGETQPCKLARRLRGGHPFFG